MIFLKFKCLKVIVRFTENFQELMKVMMNFRIYLLKS